MLCAKTFVKIICPFLMVYILFRLKEIAILHIQMLIILRNQLSSFLNHNLDRQPGDVSSRS